MSSVAFGTRIEVSKTVFGLRLTQVTHSQPKQLLLILPTAAYVLLDKCNGLSEVATMVFNGAPLIAVHAALVSQFKIVNAGFGIELEVTHVLLPILNNRVEIFVLLEGRIAQ